jgi:GntR family transcriptional regulator/MocR family aminotransferase
MAAPGNIAELMMPVHQAAELNTYSMMQDIALHLLEGGSDSREALRSMGKRQWQTMIDVLETHCPDTIRFVRPQGGASIWAEFADGIAPAEAFPRMRDQGVLCLPGRLFYPGFSGGERNLRLDFYGVETDLIEEGVRRMARALSELQGELS